MSVSLYSPTYCISCTQVLTLSFIIALFIWLGSYPTKAPPRNVDTISAALYKMLLLSFIVSSFAVLTSGKKDYVQSCRLFRCRRLWLLWWFSVCDAQQIEVTLKIWCTGSYSRPISALWLILDLLQTVRMVLQSSTYHSTFTSSSNWYVASG